VARYVGGPCNGRDAGPALYTSAYCGGVKYTLAEDGNYHALLGPDSSLGIKATLRAWRSLTYAWGPGTHTSIQRIARATTRMRKATR